MPSTPSLERLCARKLLIVTGKGGVGKSTVAASLALALSRVGRKVLLVEMGSHSSLAPVFDVAPFDYQPVSLSTGLWGMRIWPEACLREYGMMKLKLERLYSMVFENPVVAALLDFVPGLEEVLVSGKLEFIVSGREKAPDGTPYDSIILDAPPTGQGLGLLTMPGTLLSAVGAGPLFREVKRIHQMLSDHKASGVIIVTNPEELAVDEALELYEQVVVVRRLPGCKMLVNKVLAGMPGAEHQQLCQDALQSAPERKVPAEQVALLEKLLELHEFAREQDAQKQRLVNQVAVPVVELPRLLKPRLTRDDLWTLAESFLDGEGVSPSPVSDSLGRTPRTGRDP